MNYKKKMFAKFCDIVADRGLFPFFIFVFLIFLKPLLRYYYFCYILLMAAFKGSLTLQCVS